MKENIASALDKAKSERFSPEDIFNYKFQPKTVSAKKSRQKRAMTKNSKKRKTKECANPIQKHSFLQ
jgi:hypothetical protein